MKDARRKLMEQKAERYWLDADAEFLNCREGNHWSAKDVEKAYLQGWTDADSHPDTMTSDEEARQEILLVAMSLLSDAEPKQGLGTSGMWNTNRDYIMDKWKNIPTPSRKSQAAEIAKARELLERAKEIMQDAIQPGSYLSMVSVREFVTDYESLKKEMG